MRSYAAQHELLQFFMSQPFSVLLLSEPYTGPRTTVHSIRGVRVHQFPMAGQGQERRVKACILVKEEYGTSIGLAQHSSANLAVVRIPLQQRQLTIMSAYIEPDIDKHNTIPALASALSSMEGQLVLLGMDGNGAHQLWGCEDQDLRGDSLAALAASNSLSVLNTGRTPTFQSVTHGRPCSSIVDVTMTSDSLVSRVSGWRVNFEACPSSDHNAIEFEVDAGPPVRKARESTFLFKNKTANWSKFADKLQQEAEERGLESAVAEARSPQAIDYVVESLSSAIREACFASMKIRGEGQPYVPFWTSDLDLKKQQVIRLHHKLSSLKARGQPLDLAAAAHREARKEYAAAIRKESSKNFRDFCNKQGKEDVWSLTNRLIKDSPASQPPSTLRLQGSFTESSQETALALLQHFYPDDGPDTLNRHLELRRQALDLSDGPDEPPFTVSELEDCFKTMNPNRAPGHDNLTSDICHAAFRLIPDLVTSIMNTCLDLGHFPRSWKDARVKILPKPGKDDYLDLSSFRPIGLLPVMGKLLEKLVIRRITYAAQQRETWNEDQYGFREQRSTSDALRRLVLRIKKAKSEQQQVVGVSLDIKAAFDNAWWPAIQQRLRSTGVARNCHRLIQSYLCDRKVSLDLADASASKNMTKGCIQGSVCGPTFWNLVLDELLDLSLPVGCHLQAYADDVMLLVSGPTAATVQRRANAALDLILDWGNSVKLRFSPAKTQAIAFTPGSKTVALSMDLQSIPVLPCIKLLGVQLDSNLNFIAHAKYIVSKVTKTFQNLCKLVRPTWGVHPENVETIYRRVIEPTVTYAAGIWGEAAKRQSVRRILASFQRSFAIRAIRAFHTVSAVSASALAQFMPLHLKVLEVHRIEQVKATGVLDGGPQDSASPALDLRAEPCQRLHPAKRRSIVIHLASDQADADRHASSTNIYTDGSKLDSDRVGCAFVALHQDGRRHSSMARLADQCSVFQAEVLAIHRALLWVQRSSWTSDVTLFSDSRSALQAIADGSSCNSLVLSIQALLQQLVLSHVVQFVWVKAHVGIIGNEAADTAAKAAAESDLDPEFTLAPLSHFKHQIKQESMEAWQQEYSAAVTGSTTRSFFPTLDSLRLFKETAGTSFELTQILTGHGFHKQYLHRFKISPDDACPCGTANHWTSQDVHHILNDCPEFASGRQEYFGLCAELDLLPLDLASISSHPRLVTAFVSFITPIVQALKAFNS